MPHTKEQIQAMQAEYIRRKKAIDAGKLPISLDNPLIVGIVRNLKQQFRNNVIKITNNTVTIVKPIEENAKYIYNYINFVIPRPKSTNPQKEHRTIAARASNHHRAHRIEHARYGRRTVKQHSSQAHCAHLKQSQNAHRSSIVRASFA